MRKTCFITASILLIAGSAEAQVYHQGYVRNDGTYVQPHFQSAPDNNVYNNYSTRGNFNPYTGQPGTVQPYPQQGTTHFNNTQYQVTQPRTYSTFRR